MTAPATANAHAPVKPANANTLAPAAQAATAPLARAQTTAPFRSPHTRHRVAFQDRRVHSKHGPHARQHPRCVRAACRRALAFLLRTTRAAAAGWPSGQARAAHEHNGTAGTRSPHASQALRLSGPPRTARVQEFLLLLRGLQDLRARAVPHGQPLPDDTGHTGHRESNCYELKCWTLRTPAPAFVAPTSTRHFRFLRAVMRRVRACHTANAGFAINCTGAIPLHRPDLYWPHSWRSTPRHMD